MHHNFWYSRVGHNLEMSELNAAFGRFQLLKWETMEDTRLDHFQILFEGLQDLDSIEGLHVC